METTNAGISVYRVTHVGPVNVGVATALVWTWLYLALWIVTRLEHSLRDLPFDAPGLVVTAVVGFGVGLVSAILFNQVVGRLGGIAVRLVADAAARETRPSPSRPPDPGDLLRPASPTRACPRCGYQARLDHARCPDCGADLEVTQRPD